ncbi:sensor histidine kinase [Streptomyces sp. NRRL F-5126]|uniref:sensor histidine kinase n=1 Tax=Streptomyces sp. NRRL F-5126 TaxID=1463857 RepID=UPI0004C496C7|nr:HAMP domain-containing sensor histidine kinase [Streptomyces sp. NRRL F-5126]
MSPDVPERRGGVPRRRRLLLKLLALSVLVSACSVAATAWLTAHVTSVAIRQTQGQTLTDDAHIYDTLLGYAATHHDWRGVAATVRRLARGTGHRITLTDQGRHTMVDSGAGATHVPLPAQASATVNPLSVDGTPAARADAGDSGHTGGEPATAAGGSPAPCSPNARCLPDTRSPSPAAAPGTDSAVPAAPSAIDPRAVGPFLLPAAERADLRGVAQRTAACLRDQLNVSVRVDTTPSGRPVLRPARSGLYPPSACAATALSRPTRTEAHALHRLSGLVNACLSRRGAPPVRLNLDDSWTRSAPGTARGEHVVADCVEGARREQLAPYVAPPALLFVSSPQRAPVAFLDLSPGNLTRIAEVTGLVILVTLTVTALAGTRMVRPLRALAGAARRMTEGDLAARAEVAANDEIGDVAVAFNSMAERRERSEKLRKAMVNDVAHELRTPLSNIRGWLEAAEDGLAVPDNAFLTSLLDEAVLLQHVIDDLRDLSAADAGELRLRVRQVDLAELLGQVAAAHRGTAQAAGVALVTAVEGGAVVAADPVRLRQAVGNLVSNAVRHTPAGGSVTVTGRAGGARAVIGVTDTGAGIGAEDLPRVFDRFWRAEKSRNRQTGGSGLGLAIVRKLVEAHGGTITATSTPGEGSAFTITVPAQP